ncbi:MAG: NUDIX hydrolase [Patescibacteria group bacterium]
MIKISNVVNENDEIIGTETREKIHQEGLLHREVHVYFVTPNKEVICQHRAKDKDMFPDLLDATVGGHVEVGDSYEKTAIKETQEETGVEVDPNDLIFISKNEFNYHDTVTGKINHNFLSRYLYIYRGEVEDLKLEEGKAIGFELCKIEELKNLDEQGKKRFILPIYDFMSKDLAEFIKDLKL